MKKIFGLSCLAAMLCITAQAQVTQPIIPAGKIAVFKAGTSDGIFPIASARVQPCFVQVFDPATTNQSSPVLSLAMATNASVPGSVWINAHAGSEGGGLSRSSDRQFLALEGYTGNILSPTSAKPSTDQTVTRGIVRLDAFTNATSIYSDLASWFGIPAGSSLTTQDNPTGIASSDGTNFWGTGNFAGVSSELSGTMFFNQNVGPTPFEVQNYIQAAAEARIIGGTLYIVVPGGGVYNFVNPADQSIVPLPYDPNVANPYQTVAFTNLFLNWGTTYKKIANFDMNPAGTLAYGADQTFGIVKFTNIAGVWTKASYLWNSNNIGTTAQTSGNQGCFGICVDFSGTNPVIYATTMENGYPVVNATQGHQNQNRLIKIVDTGVDPGTNLVAQTLAIAATTNEFFGGIDFTPDLLPLITSNPANYATIDGGSASFSVTADCAFTPTYQWYQNSSNLLASATNSTLSLNSLTTAANAFTYLCVVSDQYGSVTSAPAILTVTASAVAPVITTGSTAVTGFVNGKTTFAPISATGTQPYTYQWYHGTTPLVDDGVKYFGSASASLTVSNLVIADGGNYSVVVMNAAGSASNVVDVLTVKYHLATINAGQPLSVTTFVGLTTSLTADQTGATPPVTYQWYRGTSPVTDTGDFSGSTTPTLTISPASLSDAGSNYKIVISNAGGSVTSSSASVTVLTPPALSSVSYSNQVYVQNFDSLPDPGGVSVNSINNTLDPGAINGIAYSLANPFDFNYPVINNSYVGGLGLSKLQGWYGAADTLFTGVDGITRFGAQDGDQSTGGVISFGPNDVNGGVVGTNRALGLLSTSTTGSTTFALKLINKSTNTLNYISLGFLGELWRNGNANGPRTMSFGYTVDPSATSFVLTAQSISNSTIIPELSFSFPTVASVTPMDGTLPANQVTLGTNNLALSSPWQPNSALWLIWSINFFGQGSGNGYAIDNLTFSATYSLPHASQPFNINASSLHLVGTGGSGGVQFTFTNTPSLSFSILGTNNVTAPVATWPVVGTAVESPAGSGQYHFTDPHPATNGAQFYILRQP
ncbi:MAG: hypothetical protein JWR26_1257 [Pedosphaera sp.]|nr:hypothetical protein [Pedosphaera sp.]